MVAERWTRTIAAVTLLICTAMAYHGIGLEEDVRVIMEQHTRAMIEEARRNDQDTISRLAQSLQTMSAGSRGGAPPPATNMNFLDMRLGKPEVFTGKEARWEEWY